MRGDFPELGEARTAELDMLARAERSDARRAGHTRPVVGDTGHASKRPLHELVVVPARRVRQKTCLNDVVGTRLAKRPRVR